MQVPSLPQWTLSPSCVLSRPTPAPRGGVGKPSTSKMSAHLNDQGTWLALLLCIPLTWNLCVWPNGADACKEVSKSAVICMAMCHSAAWTEKLTGILGNHILIGIDTGAAEDREDGGGADWPVKVMARGDAWLMGGRRASDWDQSLVKRGQV